MKKQQMLLASAMLFSAVGAQAQTNATEGESAKALKQDNAAYVFTESQLGEDEDMTQDVIMVGSNTNVYTSNVGYLWSPARFNYRAYDNRYNDIYMNGVKVNNAENGRFNYSTIGGMNDAMRNIDASSPFESNNFSMAGLGGSNNYNLRASSFGTGHKATLSGVNRNYTARVMYGYGTGTTKRGWAFYGTVGYRWANMNTSNVEGCFYNAFSYFLSVQKKWGNRHSLNLATWGNPTERAQQGASTDEAYWLANDRLYNPYWGYQGGKKRNSRVVENYEPSALLTWDYNINDKMKLTTTAFAKYVMYSSTKLNYRGQNPAPDYWKNFPSNYYDVWGTGTTANDPEGFWNSVAYWRASARNRQINWDKLYFTNQQLNTTGQDGVYWVEKRHNDHLATNLGSTFEWNTSKDSKLAIGLQLGSNKGMHYLTMDDMLGAENFTDRNTYLVGDYPANDPRIQYDLRNPDRKIKEGDRMNYDYDLFNQYVNLWAAFTKDKGISHSYITGKIGGTQMWRNGHMQNGLCADYSYGKSGTARFLDGGFKMGTNLNLGRGNALALGFGYEARAPQTDKSFVNPEMNNNFVDDLKNEKIISAELGYAVNTKWLQLNLSAYYTHTYDVTDWRCFYNDDVHSFTYNSLTGIEKDYYGVELGAKFKVTSNFNINLMGTWAEAKYINNANAVYTLSNTGVAVEDICLTKGLRESGTPLLATSIGLNYSVRGWYFNVNANYYDRIYLGFAPNMRYVGLMSVNDDGSYSVRDQYKGNGGFMLDASIGHTFRIAGHPLNVNLMLTNITNNRTITTGGYEQSRSDYTNENKESLRTYSFSNNPKKYYAQGINGMLNINFRF